MRYNRVAGLFFAELQKWMQDGGYFSERLQKWFKVNVVFPMDMKAGQTACLLGGGSYLTELFCFSCEQHKSIQVGFEE